MTRKISAELHKSLTRKLEGKLVVLPLRKNNNRFSALLTGDKLRCLLTLLILSTLLISCAPASPPVPATLETIPPEAVESIMPTMGAAEFVMISGFVTDCIDTTPEGLLDAPRKIICTVETDEGSQVRVMYTAYPPSPVGDAQRGKVRLDFHAGSILAGDYLRAGGSFDEAMNTLIVSEEGHFIETFPDKP